MNITDEDCIAIAEYFSIPEHVALKDREVWGALWSLSRRVSINECAAFGRSLAPDWKNWPKPKNEPSE